MTTKVAVRFPLGRYHATPWDASVNEARIEWPPSPWRILRALVSVWKTRLPRLQEETVIGLFNRLVEQPPSYRLPPSSVGHTRHYMPGIDNKRSLALDPFLSVSPEKELIVEFPYVANDEERKLLSDLAGALPYLGRADSVCHARLVETSLRGEQEAIRCIPTSSKREGLRLLVPVPTFTFKDLCQSPTELRKSRRLDPPKTHWVDYSIRNGQTSSKTAITYRPRSLVTAARWHLPDAGRPPIAETVAICHLLRQAVISRTKKPSYILSGRTESGPRDDQHQHAHYLAFSSTNDGRVDTLAIWAPGGLGEIEISGIASLRYLRSPEYLRRLGTYRLGLEVLASTELALPELVVNTPSRTWVSVTPYLPGRAYAKWTDKDKRLAHITADIEREVGFRGFPVPGHIEEVDTPNWRRFRRTRPNQRRGSRQAASLRLKFDEPIPGPLSLGALSHFGLGLFRPD